MLKVLTATLQLGAEAAVLLLHAAEVGHFTHLAVDLLYAWLDPRISYS
jgi:hypothetical protein